MKVSLCSNPRLYLSTYMRITLSQFLNSYTKVVLCLTFSSALWYISGRLISRSSLNGKPRKLKSLPSHFDECFVNQLSQRQNLFSNTRGMIFKYYLVAGLSQWLNKRQMLRPAPNPESENDCGLQNVVPTL